MPNSNSPQDENKSVEPKADTQKEAITAFDLGSVYEDDPFLAEPVQTQTENRSAKWLWFSLLGVVLLAMFVVFQLPKHVNTIDEEDTQVVEQEPQPAEEPFELVGPPAELALPVEEAPVVDEALQAELEAQAAAQPEAEALLGDLIALEDELKKHAVEKWAAEEFAEGTDHGRLGDENLRKKKYLTAAEEYRQAITIYQALRERIAPTLEQALTTGELALTEGDKATALQQFELALAIDPDNERGLNGLKRTETIDELIALMQRGNRLESHNQLLQAQTTYQEAITLDPLSPEAKEALTRVNSKLQDIEYMQLIAAAYTSLQNRQYADARAGFNAAGALKPSGDEHKTGLNKVAIAVRDENISNLLFEASHFENNQQWAQAAVSYSKIIELKSNHAEAQQGLAETTQKAEVLVGLNAIIDAADQLHRKEVVAKADELLLTVNNLNNAGSIIETRAATLQALVKRATTPIPVIITSDANTEVTVFKVARLGSFHRREMQLKPGPYTIVGTRAGYRDVRKTIVVTPDDGSQTLEIRCEQPI